MKNQVRIIGGKWRSRKISFAAKEDLRPTHDRIRETLFNWLAPDIVGATCLDLFAGSGVLAFEALSRGAKEAYAVDCDMAVTRQLQQNKQMLSLSEEMVIIKAACPSEQLFSRLSGITFDIVFIDPPYHQALLLKSLVSLLEKELVSQSAKIYIEYEKGFEFQLPDGLAILKRGKTRSLQYALLSRV